MTTTIKILTRSEESRVALNALFNPNNEIACANYGNGDHCNPERNEVKLEKWGERGEDVDNSLKAYFIEQDGETAALLNIGVPGDPATVIDRRDPSLDGKVLELSGIMVIDEYLDSAEVSKSISQIFKEHQAPSYTKAFVTFKEGHVQLPLLEKAGATVLTSENLVEKLGVNSLHPERFKFEENNLLECNNWNNEAEKVSHEGWHEAHPCTSWTLKTAMVFNVGPSGAIDNTTEEL